MFKVQRTSMSLKSWLGASEEAGGSWLGFCILIFIWIWSLVFGRPPFQIFCLYLDFEGANNTHVLKIFIWGFGGCWMFLIWIWHLYLNLDRVTGLWYTYILNFCSLSWLWRYKEHPYPLSPHLGLWRMLEVPNLSLASWSWLDMVTSLLYTIDPHLCSLSWFWRCKEHPCPLSPCLEDAGGS